MARRTRIWIPAALSLATGCVHYGATAGVRVPWGSQAPGASRGSVLIGLGATHLADASDDQGVVQLALGAEMVF